QAAVHHVLPDVPAAEGGAIAAPARFRGGGARHGVQGILVGGPPGDRHTRRELTDAIYARADYNEADAISPYPPRASSMNAACISACVVLTTCTATLTADDWPAWRGPHGDGQSSAKTPPLKWSRTENVRWKTPLPGPGNSSPIVWKDRVFLTQALD